MSTPPLDDAGHVRLSLREIVRDYGAPALDDASLLGSLLPDLLAGEPREARLVLAAASAGTGRLLTEHIAHGLSVEASIRDVSARLVAESMVDTSACRWIVTAYAEALGHPIAETVEDRTPAPNPATRPNTSAQPNPSVPSNAGARPDPATRAAGIGYPFIPGSATGTIVAGGAVTTPGVPAGSWGSRYGLPGAALALATVGAGLMAAKSEISVGSDFGVVALWWSIAFAPLSVAVLIRARQSTRRLDTVVAVAVITLAFLVVTQSIDPNRNYLGFGWAAGDGLAVALLGFCWYRRDEDLLARIGATLIAGFGVWLSQRSATWTIHFFDIQHWRRIVAQGLIVPAFLIATSLLCSLATRRGWTRSAVVDYDRSSRKSMA